MNTRLLILAGTIAAISCARAQSPSLWYDFDSAAAAGQVNNLGTTGTDGILTGGNISIGDAVGSSPGFSGGFALQLPNDDQGSYVDTLLSSSVIGFNGDYTASAWVNMNAFGGDSMVFGQTGGNLLHDGIRDNRAHLGHWGQDTGGVTDLNATFGTGNWFHLTWRRHSGGQTIFINGVRDASSGSAALANVANVLVGSNNGNGGGFRGSIDDVVVYGSALKANQIEFIAAGGDPNALPAPAGSGAGLFGPVGSVAPGAIPEGPSAPGGNGRWAIHEVRNFPDAAQPDNLGQAMAVLRSGQGTISTGFTSVINRTDPDTNGTGPGFFGGDSPYLTDQPGVDDNRIATLYRAIVKVTVAGDYTFGYHGDDGFALRIQNSTFTSQTGGDGGAGSIDFDSPDTVLFPNGTGDANMRMTANLPVGEHVIEMVHWEGGGGAFHELYYAKGTFSNDGDTPTWKLLGAPSTPPPTDFTRNVPGVTLAGWAVTTSTPRGVADAPNPAFTGTPDGLIDSNADALTALATSGTTVTGKTSINYFDPQSGASHSFGGDVPFERDSVNDDEDYAMFAEATLQIDVADTYRFGFRGDDGGALRIVGVGAQPGTADDWVIVTNATGATRVTDVNGVPTSDGDTLNTDIPTGDSFTQGDIFLTPGTYTIQGLFWERGGGSSWEIFAGDADAGPLALLAAGGNVNEPYTPPAVVELQIVPEPASVAMLIGGFGALLGFQRVRRRK
jgi:Concanavalin A-like lectin/glucanases superfamily